MTDWSHAGHRSRPPHWASQRPVGASHRRERARLQCPFTGSAEIRLTGDLGHPAQIDAVGTGRLWRGVRGRRAHLLDLMVLSPALSRGQAPKYRTGPLVEDASVWALCRCPSQVTRTRLWGKDSFGNP